jgi:hypothetical protein
MYKHNHKANDPGQDLPLTASLYAGGWLDTERAADFERLLAKSQEARDALAEAAARMLRRGGATNAELRPSRAYRERLKQRLLSSTARPASKKSRRDNGLLWALVGTAAAVLFILAISYWSIPTQSSRAAYLPPGTKMVLEKPVRVSVAVNIEKGLPVAEQHHAVPAEPHAQLAPRQQARHPNLLIVVIIQGQRTRVGSWIMLY